MTLSTPSQLRRVQGISDTELQLIRAFVQGAVYCWVKNRKGEWFAVRDLVGAENTDWRGTPLQPLFVKHVQKGKTVADAFEAAAKDAGWIVKLLLADDPRRFENDHTGFVSRYRWLPEANTSS